MPLKEFDSPAIFRKRGYHSFYYALVPRTKVSSLTVNTVRIIKAETDRYPVYTGIPAIPLCDNPSSKTKTAQPKHGAVKGSNLLLYLAVKPVLKNSPFFRDVAEPLQLCKYFLNKGVYHRFKRYRCCFCRNRRFWC